jgi:hypothetical protein
MRTNYILVDFESVQPELVELLDFPQLKLMIFVGSTQAKISYDIAASVQKMGDRAQYIKISGNGPNALDFHIAYYIGKLSASDPTAYFHIISKDKGFDPLIQHLKSEHIFAGRSTTVADIPLIKSANAKSTPQKIEVVLAKLSGTSSKPKTVKTLTSTIQSLFQNKLNDEEVAELLQSLEKKGIVMISGAKISYDKTSH